MGITNRNKADEIFERFKKDYTVLSKNVVNYYMDGRYELALEYEDGHVQLWNEFDRTFYPLPQDRDSMTSEQYQKEVGRRISEVMFRKNVTQQQLSEKTGIAQPQLSRYISGKTMPNFMALDKITRALRMSLDELRHIDVDTDIDRY